MLRSAPTAVVTDKASTAKNAESSLQGAENMPEQMSGLEQGFAAGFPSLKKGFDLGNVPAMPGLQTGLSVQCCTKGGGSCSCPSCKKAAAEQDDDNDEMPSGAQVEMQSTESDQSLQTQPVAEAQETETAEQETGTPGPETGITESATATSQTSLIVDDSTEAADGQMTKTEFLQQLRAQICETIGPVLATAGQTTEGCPYLNYWLDLYQEKNASEVEATVRRYAPDAANAQSADNYISIVTERALRAAEIWARTGRITGVPEGVSTTLPGENAAPANTQGAGRTAVMRKPKDGAPKASNQPANIQKELGEGQPLNEGVRSRMESVFGTSFSNVRTHTDANAASISNRVNARAFTLGNHVAFDSGEYKPGTMLGDALIAHELAHVVQQQGASASVDKMETGAANYDSLERDADHAAVGAVTSLWGGLKNGTSKMLQNSVPLLRSGLQLQRCNNNSRNTPVQAGCSPALNSLNAVATGNIVMTTAWPGSSCELAFGEPTGVGMTIRSQVTVPASCTGTLQYVQLIHRCLERRPVGGANEKARTGSYFLDTSDPYPNATRRVTAPGVVNFETSDSPSGGFTAGKEHLKGSDQFKMWLLWTPDSPAGAPRISLGMVEWNWGAEATKTGAGAGCASDWTVSNATRNGGTGSATGTMPAWTQTYPANFPAYTAGTC